MQNKILKDKDVRRELSYGREEPNLNYNRSNKKLRLDMQFRGMVNRQVHSNPIGGFK